MLTVRPCTTRAHGTAAHLATQIELVRAEKEAAEAKLHAAAQESGRVVRELASLQAELGAANAACASLKEQLAEERRASLHAAEERRASNAASMSTRPSSRSVGDGASASDQLAGEGLVNGGAPPAPPAPRSQQSSVAREADAHRTAGPHGVDPTIARFLGCFGIALPPAGSGSDDVRQLKLQLEGYEAQAAANHAQLIERIEQQQELSDTNCSRVLKQLEALRDGGSVMRV